MNRALDILRYTFVSPEVLGVTLVSAVLYLAPHVFGFPLKLLSEGQAFGLGAAGFSVACLAFCFHQGFEILDPSGAGSVLVEWPGYQMLKGRVVAAMVWCVIAIAGSLGAMWLAAIDPSATEAGALLVAVLLAAVISVASLALARIRIRELLQANL